MNMAPQSSVSREGKGTLISREVKLHQGHEVGVLNHLAVFLVAPLTPALGLAFLHR